MANHVVVTVGSILLAVLFFSIPLVLKYRVYRPNRETVASGDVTPLQLRRVSSFWCQQVEIESESESQFRSYSFETEPRVSEDDRERTMSKLDLQLQSGLQEYWGFHLLRGSRVQLSACSQLPKAGVTVLKGQKGLEKCLLEHKIKLKEKQESEEDSLSESESDQGTSSISSSQGMVGNDSVALYNCSHSLQHVELASAYTCGNYTLPFEHSFDLSYALTQEVLETDYYYFLFTSNTYLEIVPNQVFLEFVFDRSLYDWTSSSSNCSKDTLCRLPLSIGQTEKHVIVQTNIANGSALQEETLNVSCRPREGIFLLFYAAFLIIIFLSAFH